MKIIIVMQGEGGAAKEAAAMASSGREAWGGVITEDHHLVKVSKGQRVR